ncbi:hypothetical protein WJX84_002869 [Apatococcus fuscideae]|uniref:TFIIS N-terminal domain-containing protein n=1 Tax=Apatococcus fuscideae TaxID=2026836 RepID=A0AAW1T7W4_9CHLO
MAEEGQHDREKMREELFGADSEGEEEEVEQQEEVDIGGSDYEVPPDQVQTEQPAQEGSLEEPQEVFEGRQEEGAAAYDSGQQEGGEYYEDQEGYQEEEAVEEAEEDEIAAMLKAGGRKKAYEKSYAQISAEVETFLAGMALQIFTRKALELSVLAIRMDIAAEEDVEANKLGQPALAKLKMLPHLHAKVAERKIHDVLMDAGILGCLKAWIEPMPGGHLPNSRCGRAVLKRAAMMSCGTRDERLRLRQQRKRKQQQQTEADAASELEGAASRKLKPGEPGFRWHAAVPQPARLDYLEQPESKVAISSQQASAGKSAGKPDRLGAN